MKLILWNVVNCGFGCFPFIFMKNHTELGKMKLKPFLFWLPLTLFSIAASGRIYFSMCALFNFPSGEPQKYHCYIFWFGNTIVLTRRLFTYKNTRALFEEITEKYSLGSFLCMFTNIIMLQLCLTSVKLYTLIMSVEMSMLTAIESVISAFYTLGPCIIDSQCIMICYAVSEEITKINNLISSQDTPKHEIKVVIAKLRACNSIFEKFLNLYSFDIFVTVTISSLSIVIVFNSFINLSVTFLFTSLFTTAKYLLKVLYFSLQFTIFFCYLAWFGVVSTKLKRKANHSKKLILKLNLIEDYETKEIFLFFEQLERNKFSVDALGFFSVNIRFIFQGMSSAITFIVFFVQLAQMRLQRKLY